MSLRIQQNYCMAKTWLNSKHMANHFCEIYTNYPTKISMTHDKYFNPYTIRRWPPISFSFFLFFWTSSYSIFFIGKISGINGHWLNINGMGIGKQLMHTWSPLYPHKTQIMTWIGIGLITLNPTKWMWKWRRKKQRKKCVENCI